MTRSLRALLGLACVASLAAACSHDIGDDCMTSVDCDPSGTRSCDLSQPGGYCTIVGCNETSCPSGATCIRLFPVALLPATASASSTPPVTCDPAATPTGCPAHQVCVQATHVCAQCDPACEDIPCAEAGPPEDQCLADEICLDSGVCANQSYEQRECAKACSSNGDCRAGYECRKAGLAGSMVLATDPNAMTSFCAPIVPVTP